MSLPDRFVQKLYGSSSSVGCCSVLHKLLLPLIREQARCVGVIGVLSASSNLLEQGFEDLIPMEDDIWTKLFQ